MSENEKIEITDGLLVGYITGELDSRMVGLVEDWIAIDPINNTRYNEFLKSWNTAASLEPKPVVVNTKLAWKNVLNQINGENDEVIPIKRRYKRHLYFSIAASVVVLFGVWAWLNFNGTAALEFKEVVAENSGFTDELSDGSIVTFNANSSLVYPVEFAENERRVTLNGEAFFEIERNVDKPFIVDLPEDAYVKVLGTSFNIKAVEGDSLTEVYVSSGKVEFGIGADKIILLAGEKGIYNHRTGVLFKDDSSAAGLDDLFWKNEKVTFDNVPLIEAIKVVNSIAGDSIIFECSKMGNESIRSSYFKNQPVKDFLRSIELNFGLTYYLEPSGKYKVVCDGN